ncbi:ATP-dependent DNA ligase [Halobacteriales archaeon Cl-PHB]
MEYADLVAVYERLDATEANLELTDIVAEAFADADAEHLPLLVKLIRGEPFAAWKPHDLGLSSNLTKEAIVRSTGVDADEVEAQWRETGDLGSAAAWAVEHERQQTLFSDDLTVKGVHETLQEIATYEGEGSQARRIDEIAGLIADADPDEAKYVVRTVLGHLRLGIGEGTIRDAIAQAFLADRDEEQGDGETFEKAVAAVERAFQVTNDYREVAEKARDEGISGLDDLDVELFRPLRVMLAKKADGLEDGFETVAGDAVPADSDQPWGDALLEYKLDGFRIQIHKQGDDVTVFTRRLEDVTAQFPDVVELVHDCVTAEECIVEGEVLAYDAETGNPLPFQDLSQRIKRKYEIERMVEEIPVGAHLFDLLYLDGETYMAEPLEERLVALDGILDPEEKYFQRMANRTTADLEVAESFYADALDAGQEGLMVKNLGAAYQPGNRVGYMVKVKPTMEPLDLTVVKAKWSEGRRSNNLGRLYLGCRDGETGEFLTVGRLSTGFTDEELAEITRRLEPTIVEEDGREVVFEPQEVIEVEYEEIQESPEYESGYALRFPRFLRFRDDLGLDDVDTVNRVEALYDDQH